MKKIILILTIFLVVSCNTTKNMTSKPEAKNPRVEITSAKPKDDVTAGIEPDLMVAEKTSHIMVGSSMESGSLSRTPSTSKIKIINITNTKVTSSTTNQGHVAYKIPTEMSVRSTYQVLVRISKSTLSIFENINGDIKTSQIPITETMEVKLIDPSPDDRKMFSIIADNDGIQLVENNESVTQWTWNVTPLKAGTANLKVMIAVITNGNKKETVYEDTVKVKTDMAKEIPFFFGQYWQWLLSTLVIPFGIWLYKKYMKKDEDEKTN